jgi:hypothetical protein
MSTMDTTEYEGMSVGARVMRGMAWIDEQESAGKPFDLMRVDTSLGRFDLSNASRCVLGQAYYGPVTHAQSRYGEALWIAMGLDSRAYVQEDVDRSVAWARGHGFLCLVPEGDQWREDFYALTAAWRAAIDQRRADRTVA